MRSVPRASRFYRGASIAAALWALLSCRADERPEITVVVDRGGPEQIAFEPKTRFAEYIELSGNRHEIRITLAEHEEVSCDRYAPPGEGQAAVMVTVATPPKKPPEPGRYVWSGTLPGDPPLDKPVAIPKAQIGNQSFVFPAGGGVKLTSLKLEPHGTVEGLLDFRFPGDASHGATQIVGRFEARFCRFAPAPSE